MAQSSHERVVIDKNGDTLITLTSRDDSFAIWDPLRDEFSSPKSSGNEWKSKRTLENERVLANKVASEEDESNATTETPEEILETTIVYQVSSKHLETASGKFRSELTGPWSENVKGEDGLFHLTAENWDPDVFKILLNILHLRNRQVPKSTNLDTLTKIAVLVDYYRCWEAVETWTTLWIDILKKKELVPTTYCGELILWMQIAWVFELDEEFEKTTAIAVRQSDTAVIRDMDLPIPPAILDALELRRYQVIDSIMSICHDWIPKFCDEYNCPEDSDSSFACGSVLLGALTRGMHRLGCLSPKPEIPFDGHSFHTISKAVKELPTPEWWSETRSRYSNSHECSLKDTVGPDIDAVVANIRGLNLCDFRDRAKELDQ
ncbi:hypothetical protein P153DRAFT_300543 [Dothidotthia symphoricarpi CBS 119687]|uniref:BTB domain-containing protein n=1 Tax=Dothidotthia symphoricarpi CBS 119687 TaxID=1392245 RepID=A0A6A6A1U4_9PLEO|nr:uncharacterized protein P153DRAFT_300543 [Dothidotthia symphoricarpi CBS 119687]KAF2124917.1 hypothetical protein P153DRAFT_300543 [Dothidotthia symphoricarpi CBS 119687]